MYASQNEYKFVSYQISDMSETDISWPADYQRLTIKKTAWGRLYT
jgi:hypothetical protein